jgi:hypothetical protein
MARGSLICKILVSSSWECGDKDVGLIGFFDDFFLRIVGFRGQALLFAWH